MLVQWARVSHWQAQATTSWLSDYSVTRTERSGPAAQAVAWPGRGQGDHRDRTSSGPGASGPASLAGSPSRAGASLRGLLHNADSDSDNHNPEQHVTPSGSSRGHRKVAKNTALTFS
jgi:hypothetical protein